MKLSKHRLTESQLSRWLATGLVGSSFLLGGVLVLVQSTELQASEPAAKPVVPVVPATPAHPASPTAPPAFTPDTRPPPDPRTPVEVAMDDSIAERVKRALADDHLTKTQPILIGVTRGITNLSGTVSDPAIARRALDIARATGGVTAVQDAMKVEGATEVRHLR